MAGSGSFRTSATPERLSRVPLALYNRIVPAGHGCSVTCCKKPAAEGGLCESHYRQLSEQVPEAQE